MYFWDPRMLMWIWLHPEAPSSGDQLRCSAAIIDKAARTSIKPRPEVIIYYQPALEVRKPAQATEGCFGMQAPQTCSMKFACTCAFRLLQALNSVCVAYMKRDLPYLPCGVTSISKFSYDLQ